MKRILAALSRLWNTLRDADARTALRRQEVPSRK